MAQQNTQTGATSPQDTARAQAARANEAQAEAGKQSAPAGTGQESQPVMSGAQQETTPQQSGTGSSQGVTRREDHWPGGWQTGPFGLMSRMFEEMDRFFDELGFGRSRLMPRPQMLGERQPQRSMGGLWAPQIEVSEREGQLVICADLPGLRREDVKVDLTDDVLTIQGERQENRQGRGYSERTYGSFYRTIPLPEGVNAEGAQAKFRDGVLEVSIPLPQREQQQKHKQLEIR
jgi:HSP20 family protein